MAAGPIEVEARVHGRMQMPAAGATTLLQR